ncbi:MAG: hypothetical protein C0392_05920 [Syntrophus sp. (in: bacteria)]|nr:hypothetical protein [Syntrophus sp. (in: bacteria)]
MRTFFYPEKVAIFGVSDAPSNLARVIVENLERFKFRGKVFPVGSHKGTVAGKDIILDIDEIEDIPDLAVLLVPAARVPEALERCAEKGIHHVIIETGGFSELDDKKKILEADIRRISLMGNMKIIGPNCFGVSNFEKGLVLPFFILKPDYMKTGHISLISQSGGVVYDTCMLASHENLGLNKLISIGNKLLLNENDFLEYLISDPRTRIIGLYLENFSEGRRFVEIAASTDKPIILLKTNRSPAGREIAQFHTTALAGNDLVAEAALKEAGIHRVQNLAEMIDAYKVFTLPPLQGRRLALITRSGGHGVLSADSAHRYGFDLAVFSDTFYNAVKEKKINVIRATNPLDVGDVYQIDAYTGILEKALQEKGVDGVAFIVTFSSESDGSRVQRFIEDAATLTRSYAKPVALCAISNREQWLAIRGTADFPVFTDIDHALHALRKSLDHYDISPLKRVSIQGRLKDTGSQKVSLSSASARFMGPDEAFRLLEGYGLNIPSYGIAETPDGARLLTGKIGFPVALKTASPLILHKTENKGVALNIADEDRLVHSMAAMNSEKYLIQSMVPPGHEVIVGGKRDSEFGHILLFGLGGIFVEVLQDSAIRLVPVDEKTAEEMINEIRGSAILKGFRGKPAADMNALTKALVNISRLLTDHPEIRSLDINPLIVHEEGKGCTVVDVKIETDC